MTIIIDFFEPCKMEVTSRIAINNISNGNKREHGRDQGLVGQGDPYTLSEARWFDRFRSFTANPI